MIVHLVSFRWNEGVTEQQVADATAALLALPGQIPALRSYSAGPNLHLTPSDRDFGVAAVVEDEAALHEYLDHPAHKAAVADHLGPMIADRAAVQVAFGALPA